MKGKLIIFSAPSGSGKTTIVHYLLEQDLNLEFSISATSRNPRAHEIHGRDYYFLSPDAFKEQIDKEAFLEWEEVYENQYYGTLKSEVERIRKLGKHVLFDIDVVGGLNVKKYYGAEALAVFVKPPSLEVMAQRLKNRGTDSEEQLIKRIAKAEEEMKYAPSFDYILINDSLEEALAEAFRLVKDFTG